MTVIPPNPIHGRIQSCPTLSAYDDVTVCYSLNLIGLCQGITFIRRTHCAHF